MTAAPPLPDGYVLHLFERLESTNDVARRLAQDGAPSGQVVVAAEQTRGRGRYGRTWASPPGNLYASLLVRPGRPLAEAAQLSLVAGLALAEALEALGPPGLRATLKWPNDVLLDGAKTAGILLESAAGPEGLAAWVIVGTGVNIASFPDGVAYPATALHRAGFAPDLAPLDLLPSYVQAFDAWFERWRAAGFAPVRAAWCARGFGIGAEVTLRLEREELRGRFVELSRSGGLVLEQPDGRRREIAAGDLFYVAGGG